MFVELVGERSKVRIGIVAPTDSARDTTQVRRADAYDAPRVHGGQEPRHKLPVVGVDVSCELAADELACGVITEARQFTTEHVGEDLGSLSIIDLLDQTVFVGAGQALEACLGAHRALLGIEARLGDQLDWLM